VTAPEPPIDVRRMKTSELVEVIAAAIVAEVVCETGMKTFGVDLSEQMGRAKYLADHIAYKAELDARLPPREGP
jgi:hypothetical protein